MTIFTHRPRFFIHSGYVLLMTSSSIAEDLTNVCGSTNVMRARENRYLTRLISILFPDKFTTRRVRNVVFYPSVYLHHNRRDGVFTGVSIVSSTVCSGKDQIKHQSSASLVPVRGIHRSPVDSPHKEPVSRKMFPFDDVIMILRLVFVALGQSYDCLIATECKMDRN